MFAEFWNMQVDRAWAESGGAGGGRGREPHKPAGSVPGEGRVRFPLNGARQVQAGGWQGLFLAHARGLPSGGGRGEGPLRLARQVRASGGQG